MKRHDSLPSDCVYVCNYCGGFERPFLSVDESNGEEVDYRTNYSGDGGRCMLCGKFAPVLMLCVRELDWMEKEDEDDNDGDKKMMSDEDVKSLLSGHYEVVIPYPFNRKTDGRYIRCSKCGAKGTSNLYLCQKFKRPYVNWLYCKNCWCCVPFCMPEDISMKGLLIGDD